MPLPIGTSLLPLIVETEWLDGDITSGETQSVPLIIQFWAVSCPVCKLNVPRLQLALCLILCAFVTTGCLVSRHARRAVPDAKAIDQAWAKAGLMSFSDGQHLRLVEQKVQHDGGLSDDDIDWLITLMGQPSSSPALAHIMVMSDFGAMTKVTVAQHKKIRNAVAPSLTRVYPDDTYHEVNRDARRLITHLDRLVPAN